MDAKILLIDELYEIIKQQEMTISNQNRELKELK
jgi:hypothetical protein